MMKRIISVIMILVLSICFSGCGHGDADNVQNEADKVQDGDFSGSESKDESMKEQGKADQEGADKQASGSRHTTPDDRNNNGLMNIMENEYGYYYNIGMADAPDDYMRLFRVNGFPKMSLAFHDTGSETDIFLCNKPECRHQGDENCVATYKDIYVINTVLYEDYLYIYGIEVNDNIYSYNLYKVPQDGSSIDKIGTVFEAVNDLGGMISLRPTHRYSNDDYYFIIHNGYAYLPYFFMMRDYAKGFKGGGLKRMDIDTGSVEDIYTVPQHTFGFPFELHAEGNYVYYYLKANTTDYGWFAYDIEKKEAGHTPWDIAYAEKNGIELKEKKSVFTLPDAENDRYGFKIGFSTDKVQGKDYTDVSELTDDDLVLKIYPYKKYDTEPLLDKAFTLDVKRSEMRIPGPVMLYEDKLIYAGDNKTVVCGIGEDNWGQKLGEFSYESSYDQYIAEVGKYSSATGDFAQKFHLVNGKLYKVVRAGMDDQWEHYYSFYSCDIDSILKGNGEWKLEFTNKWPG